MKNQLNSGAVVKYTNATGTDISAGDVVLMGRIAGVAIVDITNGGVGNVALKGVYRLAKKTATDVIAQGALLRDDTGIVVASAAADIFAITVVGRAVAASNSATATVDVALGL